MPERKLTIMRGFDLIPGVRALEPNDPNQSPPTVTTWEVSGPEDWIRSLSGRFEFPFEDLGPEASSYSGWLATCQAVELGKDDAQPSRAWGVAIPGKG